ncbi:xan-1 [Symbiodinium natans]|uniref:Xan-1 protein n=1 Tax=Symbiodinium natans TaxID=878477 RepID=A0A812SBQ6_9DINO|nr:xan-1 [Symbiodinium natans]
MLVQLPKKDGGVTARVLHPFLGAVVEGVDTSSIGQEEVTTLLAPLLESYGLLLFRNQKLSPRSLREFVTKFPDTDVEELQNKSLPFADGDPSCVPELPGVRVLGTQASDRALWHGAVPETCELGMDWHTDGCGITGLYAAQVPHGEQTRNTLWASGYRAWDVLSDEAKKQALGMSLVFGPRYLLDESVATMCRYGGRMSENGLRRVQDVDSTALTKEQLQRRESSSNTRRYLHLNGSPARQHPFTGRTTLWTSPFFLEECRDMGLEQAKIQLEEILLPGLSGDAVYKHDWRIGDLVLFDNRSMMHSTTKLVDAPQLMYQVFLRTKAQMKSAKQTQP